MVPRSVLVAVLATALPLRVTPSQSPPVAFVNVSVVPMDRERVLTGQTVVVVDGRILSIGPASNARIPTGALRLDGTGRFLMPGLTDMHAHFSVTGDSARNDVENQHLATVFAAHGITTVRSMNGSARILALRSRIDAGELLGPRIHTTGPINGASRTTTRRVTTVAEADSLVAADIRAGYDAIKLANLAPEIYLAFLAAARRGSIPVYGHVPRPMTFELAARGGLGSAEHVIPFAISLVPPEARAARSGPGSLAPERADWSLLPPLATQLRDHGVWVCPTLTVARRFSGAERNRRLADSSMRYVPRRMRDAWAADVDAESTAPVPGLLDFGLTLTKRLHDAGVGLLLGSDDLNPLIVPGLSLHEELALFVRAGLSPFEALRAGTSDAAKFLRSAREFGTIGIGQRADLLLLEANPLENVANASRRVGVMVAGRWFPEGELQRRLREAGDGLAK